MDKKIIQFIMDSKKKGYASVKSIFKKIKGGGRTCVVKKGNLMYTDTYFGSSIDCGQERVYENGKVIWVMDYRGGIIKRYELHHEAFNFLKKCISKIPKKCPLRGPPSLSEKKFRYENKWKGDIESFTGEENIYYDGEKICFRNYLGGIIKNKS